MEDCLLQYAFSWNGLCSVFLAADPIIGIFTKEPIAKEIATNALKIICIGYVFFAYGMVIGQSFNGAGDTKTPLLINFVFFWLIQIPLAYYLAVYLDWQSTGVFVTISFCHSLQALISIYIFRKGYWKTVQV